MNIFARIMCGVFLFTLCSGAGWVACSPSNPGTEHTGDGGGHDAPAHDTTGSQIPEFDYAVNQMTKGKTYQVSYEVQTSDKKIPLNELYDIVFKVKDDKGNPAKDVGLMINSCMPDHGHCMLVKPEVEKIGDGEFKVRGMQYHMQGHWEIYVDVMSNGKVGEKECNRRCSCTSGDCALFNVWMAF